MKTANPDEFPDDDDEDRPPEPIEDYGTYYCYDCGWQGEGLDVDDVLGEHCCPLCSSKRIEHI